MLRELKEIRRMIYHQTEVKIEKKFKGSKINYGVEKYSNASEKLRVLVADLSRPPKVSEFEKR